MRAVAAAVAWLGVAPAPARAEAAVAQEAPASASAGSSASSSSTVSAGAGVSPPSETAPSRWRGSTLSFDQSVSTQTVGLGADYQSADPTYEWWLALRPRFYVYERPRDAVNLSLWTNLYLELTNSDTTTRTRELLLGPTYAAATYERLLRERGEYRTAVAAGPRITLPTDEIARAAGQIVGLGLTGALSQSLPLRGKSARALTGARLALGAIYTRPVDRATTPVSGGLQRLREDVAGRTVISDQLGGAMNARHTLSASLSGDLQVARRLGLSLAYVWIGSWLYASPDVPIKLATGDVLPATPADPSAFRVRSWLTGAVSYGLTDELSLALGYYNLANQLGADGTRRNPLWSPSARFFFTVTAQLDGVYRRLRGRPSP